MAKKNVKFTVTPTAGIQNHWVRVNETDLELSSAGKASVRLDAGTRHFVSWGLLGSPGASIAIVGIVGVDTKVVEVKKGKIGPGRYRGVGYKGFEFE